MTFCPSATKFFASRDGARQHGLLFHVSAMAGISRAVWAYDDAKREDRRNAQWFASGAIVAPAFSGSPEQPSAPADAPPARYPPRPVAHPAATPRA